MKQLLIALVVALASLTAENHLLAVSLNIGDIFMSPNSQHEFTFDITGSADIAAFEFDMQVGGGTDGPTIPSVDVVFPGSVFWENNFEGQSVTYLDPRTLIASAITDHGTVQVSGKPIVRFSLDTTGLLPGSQYPLKIKDITVGELTFTTYMLTDLGEAVPMDLTDGIVYIVEPSSITWTKGVDGLWSEPGSWSGSSVPHYFDNVTIGGSVTVTDTSLITEVGSLEVVQGATLNCNSLIADSLTIGGPGTAATVPEPGSLILVLAGVLLLGFRRWQKNLIT